MAARHHPRIAPTTRCTLTPLAGQLKSYKFRILCYYTYVYVFIILHQILDKFTFDKIALHALSACAMVSAPYFEKQPIHRYTEELNANWNICNCKFTKLI